jgi:hypothetical protein
MEKRFFAGKYLKHEPPQKRGQRDTYTKKQHYLNNLNNIHISSLPWHLFMRLLQFAMLYVLAIKKPLPETTCIPRWFFIEP